MSRHTHLYKSRWWKGFRLTYLAANPLCIMCQKAGRTTPATVVDHVEPHKGDPVKFREGPFQPLCQQCHSGPKQREEIKGYSNAIGADGFPSDPRHPANRGATQ